MKINNRTIALVEYRTDRTWVDQLPQGGWLCVLVVEEKRRLYVDEVITKLLLRDVAWVCAVGAAGEWVHDLLDEEISFREIEALYLPPHDVMSTWHDDIEECLWFSLYAAHTEAVRIDHVAVLDLTQGAALPFLKRYLATLAVDPTEQA